MATNGCFAYLVRDIRAKVARQEYEFTKHAVDQSITRRIPVAELEEAIERGELIEDYPHDKYGPGLLLRGYTRAGRPLNIQCSYRPVHWCE